MTRTLAKRVEQLETSIMPDDAPRKVTIQFVESDGEIVGTRIGPQDGRADERVRELIQRRCQRPGISYEEPLLESRSPLGRMSLTAVLRTRFVKNRGYSAVM